MDPKALWLAEIILAGLTLFIRSADNPVESNDLFLFSFLLVVGTLVSLSNEYSGYNLQEDGSLDDPLPSFSWVALLFAAFAFVVAYAGDPIRLSLSIGISAVIVLLCTAIRLFTIWPRWNARKSNRKKEIARLRSLTARTNQTFSANRNTDVTIITDDYPKSPQTSGHTSVTDNRKGKEG